MYRLAAGLGLSLTCLLSTAWAGDPAAPTQPESSSVTDALVQAQPVRPPTPRPSPPVVQPAVPTPRPTQAAASDPATLPLSRTSLASIPRSSAPEMLGDYLGQPGLRCVETIMTRTVVVPVTRCMFTGNPSDFCPLRGQSGFLQVTVNEERRVQQRTTVCVAVPTGSGFKIADNQSPMPLDRVFFSGNYYDDVNSSANARLGNLADDMRLYRATFGIEKTLHDGLISIGLGSPVNALGVNSPLPNVGGSDTDIGNLSAFIKYAPWRNLETNDVLSLGLAVTFPTGPGPLNGTALQPFIAGLYNFGEFYVQGFTSVDVPTDDKLATLLFNDIGIGYYAYRSSDESSRLQVVAPTFEVHVTTPLDHRCGCGELAVPDTVNLTAGVNVLCRSGIRIGAGLAVPVTGPRPFGIEGIVQASWRF